MLLVLGVMAAMGGFMVLGGFYLKAGKARSLSRLSQSVDADVRARLESIAPAAQGRVVEGPALETPNGRLMLLATQAPRSLVIDAAKFTAPAQTSHQLTIVSASDVAKVMIKGLHLVSPDPPDMAQGYKVFSSDDEFARDLLTPLLFERIEALGRASRARPRLQVAGGKVVIQIHRGLGKPEELKDFYDGCLAIVGCLREKGRL